MQIVKPPHNKYLLRNVDEEIYIKYYHGYAKAKKAGFRSAVGFLSDQEICTIVWELVEGKITCYGKKRFAHQTVSEVMDISGNGFLSTLGVDMVVFGQGVPVGDTGRFNIMDNSE